jgi:hypothetical protein
MVFANRMSRLQLDFLNIFAMSNASQPFDDIMDHSYRPEVNVVVDSSSCALMSCEPRVKMSLHGGTLSMTQI